MKEVVTNLTVVSIWKYIHVSDNHTCTLNLPNITRKAREKHKCLILRSYGRIISSLDWEGNAKCQKMSITTDELIQDAHLAF